MESFTRLMVTQSRLRVITLTWTEEITLISIKVRLRLNELTSSVTKIIRETNKVIRLWLD